MIFFQYEFRKWWYNCNKEEKNKKKKISPTPLFKKKKEIKKREGDGECAYAHSREEAEYNTR